MLLSGGGASIVLADEVERRDLRICFQTTEYGGNPWREELIFIQKFVLTY